MLDLRHPELDLNIFCLGLQALPEPIFIYDVNAQILFSNSVGAELLNAESNPITTSFEDCVRETLQKGLKIQRDFQSWTALFTPLKNSLNEPTSVLVSMRKATIAEHRFRELFENISLLTVGLNLQGHVTFVNRHFGEVTGWAREEVLGLDWFSKFVPETEAQSIVKYFLKAVSGKLPRAAYESSITTKTGQTRIISWHSTAFRDQLGQIIGLASIGEDITEKRFNEAKLREQREEILAFVSHEVRSPLISIQALVDMAKDEMDSPESLLNRFKSIQDQVCKIDHLSKDLLESCVHRTGELRFNFKLVEVKQILKRVYDRFVPLTNALHKLEIDLPESPLWGQFDAARLEQVFSNLLSNAFKYTSPQGGEIQIVARRLSNDLCRIEFRDQGIGIPQENLEMIFELFTRGKNASVAASPGYGIGLKIARDFIHKHKGKIWATSELSKGSVFHIELPLCPESTSIPS